MANRVTISGSISQEKYLVYGLTEMAVMVNHHGRLVAVLLAGCYLTNAGTISIADHDAGGVMLELDTRAGWATEYVKLRPCELAAVEVTDVFDGHLVVLSAFVEGAGDVYHTTSCELPVIDQREVLWLITVWRTRDKPGVTMPYHAWHLVHVGGRVTCVVVGALWEQLQFIFKL